MPGIPVLGLGSQALINLVYVLLLSLGGGGVGVIARQPYGLYLVAAGSSALIASATRSTWTLLLFGRTQSLE